MVFAGTASAEPFISGQDADLELAPV